MAAKQSDKVARLLEDSFTFLKDDEEYSLSAINQSETKKHRGKARH